MYIAINIIRMTPAVTSNCYPLVCLAVHIKQSHVALNDSKTGLTMYILLHKMREISAYLLNKIDYF